MFDELMGQSQNARSKVNEELAAIPLEVQQNGVSLKGNATGQIDDVDIDAALLTVEKKDELQDILVILLEEFRGKAGVEAEKISKNMLNDLLSGGLGNLFG